MQFDTLPAAGAIQATDQLLIVRDFYTATKGTIEDIMTYIAAVGIAGLAFYPDTATADADAGLDNGSFFMVAPSAYGGAADLYQKGAPSVLRGVFAAPDAISSAVEGVRAEIVTHVNVRELFVPKPTCAAALTVVSEGDIVNLRMGGLNSSPYTARRDDFVDFQFLNAKENVSTCWDLAGGRARYNGRTHETANFFNEREAPSYIAKGGTGYSTFSFAMKVTDYARGYVGDEVHCGPFHGHMEFISADWQVDGVNLPWANFGAGLHNTVYASSDVVFTQRFHLITPNDKIACRVTLIWMAVLGQHIFNQIVFDFSHADVDCTPGMGQGYTGMMPFLVGNRIKPAGASAVAVDAGVPGAQTNHGKKTLMAAYHTSHPEILFEKAMRYGVPMRINGVDDPAWSYSTIAGAETLTIENNGYAKQYDNTFQPPAGTLFDMSGKIITVSNSYQVKQADPS